uniref:BTB domain-containing protein n=1 Tax=Globodera rostochiensis TaxID=31243 RepID=A0A914GVI1_GLORO
MSANIYDDYFIIDEKLASDFIQNSCTAGCFSQFILRTACSELELKVVNESGRLQIKDVAPHSTNASGPLAEIVVLKLEGATQTIEYSTMLDNGGGSVDLEFSAVSIVIRILEKRQLIDPCPPLSFQPNDDLTVHIGKRQVTVSGSWLMSVSPVFEGMLTAKMKEQQERTLKLNSADLGFTMDQFELFLLYTSRKLWRKILPNPTNVLDLLHLADYFQVDWLRQRCDLHLVSCAEIELLKRFLLVDRYGLVKMKDFFLRSLSVISLKEFVQTNREHLSPAIGERFLFELTMRLSEAEE